MPSTKTNPALDKAYVENVQACASVLIHAHKIRKLKKVRKPKVPATA